MQGRESRTGRPAEGTEQSSYDAKRKAPHPPKGRLPRRLRPKVASTRMLNSRERAPTSSIWPRFPAATAVATEANRTLAADDSRAPQTHDVRADLNCHVRPSLLAAPLRANRDHKTTLSAPNVRNLHSNNLAVTRAGSRQHNH